MSNERRFNSPSQGDVILIEDDKGEIVDARKADGSADKLDVGKLKSEFKPADPADVDDPVGTAPPLTEEDPDLRHGPTTALSGHEVEGFPNDQIPEKGLRPAEANKIAEDKGVPEATTEPLVGTEAGDEKASRKQPKKG